MFSQGTQANNRTQRMYCILNQSVPCSVGGLKARWRRSVIKHSSVQSLRGPVECAPSLLWATPLPPGSWEPRAGPCVFLCPPEAGRTGLGFTSVEACPRCFTAAGRDLRSVRSPPEPIRRRQVRRGLGWAHQRPLFECRRREGYIKWPHAERSGPNAVRERSERMHCCSSFCAVE